MVKINVVPIAFHHRPTCDATHARVARKQRHATRCGHQRDSLMHASDDVELDATPWL
jgi:hypothetical protein